MHHRLSASAGTVAIAIAAVTGVSAARAQSASAAESAPASEGVEDIVVTAQKRSENLQDVPIAITAVTADAAKAAGINDTTDLGAVTPGLNVSQVTIAPVFFMRGVGTALSLVGDEGSVSVVVDGIPFTSLPGSILSLNNIERIEVLRGPQGTLFGRNADGGVINVITKDPSTTTAGDFSAGYGNYDTFSGSAYLTTGLGENAAIDTAVQAVRQGNGFGTNIFNGQDVNFRREYAIRSKLKFEPTDSTTIRVTGDYFLSTGNNSIGRNIIEGAVGTFGQRHYADFQQLNLNQQPRARSRSYGASARIDQELSFGQITSITGYRNTFTSYDLDQDGEPVGLVNAFFHDPEKQFTQELQLGSLAESKIKWIVGGFYLKSKAAGDPITLAGLAFAPLGGFQSRFGEQRTRSLAGFGQVTVPLGNTTNVTGGLRYTSDKRNYQFSQTSPVVPVGPVTKKESTFNKLTWRFSLDQKIDENILAYASVSRGFKSGLFNVLTPTNPTIQPETLDAYEAGLKTQLFDRKLRFNVSGFYYNYKDIQVSQIVAGTAFFLNAAKAHIYGVDVDFEARPVRNFTLSGGVELLHARYKSFAGAPATFPNPIVDADPLTPGVQCGVNPQLAPGPRTGGNTNCTIDVSGRQMVRAPDAQVTLTGRYVVPSSVGDFGASLTWAYSASFPWEPQGRLRQEKTNIFNAQLSWEAPGKAYGVRLWARNVTNLHYYTAESSSIGDTGTPAAPRTYGASVEFHF